MGVYDAQDLREKVTEQCLQTEPPVRAVFTITQFQGQTIVPAEMPAMDISERPCCLCRLVLPGGFQQKWLIRGFLLL